MGKNEQVFSLKAIGKIHTPFKTLDDIPIQPIYARGIKGRVSLFPEYAEGLRDLDGFSHIYLIFYFHKVNDTHLRIKPHFHNEERGIFATRAPSRPNHIGMSMVELIAVKKNEVFVENVDILDGTPLLDIKPFSAHIDFRPKSKRGWLSQYDDE